MTVGTKPITESDIVNEIKIILILNNESYSAEKSKQLQEAAVKSTIQRTIKLIELEKKNYFNFSEKDLENELIRLSTNINLDLETLKNVFASNDVNFSTVEDHVKIELYWNSLIFQLYKDRISINPEEIEEQLKELQNKNEEEYLISEILIKINENDKMDDKINEIKNKIKIEGFENVAKSSSISATSAKGGDMGWINENIISAKLKSKIVATPIGKLSEPILLPQGILIFKVRDKRKVKNDISLEEAKNQLVNSKKTKILQMYSLSHFDKLRRSYPIKFFNE